MVASFVAWFCMTLLSSGLEFSAASQTRDQVQVNAPHASYERHLEGDGFLNLTSTFSNLLLALNPSLRQKASSISRHMHRGQGTWMGKSEVLNLDEFAVGAVVPSDGGNSAAESGSASSRSRAIDMDEIEELIVGLQDDDDDVDDDVAIPLANSGAKPSAIRKDDEEIVPPTERGDPDTVGTTLDLLEWDRLSSIVAFHAETGLGRKSIEAGLPVHLSREESEQLHREVDEVEVLQKIAFADIPSLNNFYNLKPYAKYASKDGALTGNDFVDVALSLQTAARLMALLSKWAGNAVKLLPSYFETVSSEFLLLNDIEKSIQLEGWNVGKVLTSANPELGKVRNQIEELQLEVNDRIRSVAMAQKQFLSNPSPMTRQDRPVLSVIYNMKSKVPGQVLGVSNSGGSVYIEPRQCAELNTKLAQLKKVEKKLEKRVLKRLSNILGHPDTVANINVLVDRVTKVDMAFARARYSAKVDASPVAFRDSDWIDDGLEIFQLRHPLLVYPNPAAEPDETLMVPMDVLVPPGVRSVVITGPNTGGKTIALKTLGLAALMAKAGLRVLCKVDDTDKARIPFFDAVMADIGDDQSITQSLSTFSAHVGRIRRILNKASELKSGASLVLLDEVGSGTDPTEGSALGMAVLRQLAQDASLSLATTHHGRLKTLKYSEDGLGHLFENACVEFDVESLAPTYKVLWGVPGQSNALAIAERLGLQAHVVKDARELLKQDSEDGVALETVIKDLSSERSKQQELNEELEALQESTEKQKALLKKQTASNLKYELSLRKQTLENVQADEKRMRDDMRRTIEQEERAAVRKKEREENEAIQAEIQKKRQKAEAERQEKQKLKEIEQANQMVVALQSQLEDVTGEVPLHKLRKDLGKGKVDPEIAAQIEEGDRVSALKLFGELREVTRTKKNKIMVENPGGYDITLNRGDVTCCVPYKVQLKRTKKNHVDLEAMVDEELLAPAINKACKANAEGGVVWIRIRTRSGRKAVCQVLEKDDLVDWYTQVKYDPHQPATGVFGLLPIARPEYESPDTKVWLRAHLVRND